MATIRIVDIGAGQYVLTNGHESRNLRLDESIVPVCETFGMTLRHRNGCTERWTTDGTVTCDGCGQSADTFFYQALRYLGGLAQTERGVRDPGYFSDRY